MKVDHPNKAQIVNERITEIERTLTELLFEKRKCLELKDVLAADNHTLKSLLIQEEPSIP